jgi:hypothetical protein
MKNYKHHSSYKVVEHWYNSYKGDMLAVGLPQYVPPIKESSSEESLKYATIMDFGKGDSCPNQPTKVRNVTYECMDLVFDIKKWYVNEMMKHDQRGHKNDNKTTVSQRRQMLKDEMDAIMKDPMLGRRVLFYKFFSYLMSW